MQGASGYSKIDIDAQSVLLLDGHFLVCYYRICVSRRSIKLFYIIKVEAREAVHKYGEYKHMPIAINFVSSRRKKIAVDVVPAEWQTYIAH